MSTGRPHPAPVLAVAGGVTGVEATWSGLHALATSYDAAAERLRAVAAADAAVLLDPALVASAPLAPASFARAEAAVLAVTGGPDGLALQSLRWEVDAGSVRASAALLREADEAAAARTRALARLLSGAAGLLGGLYSGTGTTTRARPDLSTPAGRRAPGSVGDLVGHLGELSALSGPDDVDDQGTFAVQTLTGPDGEVRHLLHLPGTDDLTTLPWTQDDDVRDLGTNLRLLAGDTNGYAEGALAALAQAGVRPDEPVLAVGHSQGGMLAGQLVATAGLHGYAVTRAVTLGSPTATVEEYPDGSVVLSLENHGDVVPTLDGAPNPGSLEQVTVTVDAGEGGVDDPAGAVHGHHSFAAYSAGAAAVDASTDPAVEAHVAALADAGFLPGPDAGVTVSTTIYQVTR